MFLAVVITKGESWVIQIRHTIEEYKVIFENDRVRVFDYRDKPGDMTKMQYHGDFVFREFKGGEILWSDEQSHIGENIGDTNTHVLIVELKEYDAD